MVSDDQKKEQVGEATDTMSNDDDGVKSTLKPLGKKRERPGDEDVKDGGMNTSPEPAKRVRTVEIEEDKQQGEETSEEPTPPWICDIYRRDIAQFLSREEIEEMRVALPSWMLPVMACPNMLPRRVYDSLEVINATGNNYRVNEQGYIWFGRNEHEWDGWNGGANEWRVKLAGDPFHEIIEFSRCCKDEKAKTAEALAGHLLYPKLDEKTPVGLRLGLMPRVPVRRYQQRTVVWRAANKLTKDTGAGLLHFLHHLDGCCVRRLFVQTSPPNNNDGDDGGGDLEGELNPRIFELYSEVYGKALRLYAKKVAEWDDGDDILLFRWHGGGAAIANPNPLRTTDLVTMKTARQLCGGGQVIRPFPCVSVRFNNGQTVLNQICSLRPYCNKLMLHARERRVPADFLDGINHIVNYFKHDFGGNLAMLIPQVKLTIHGRGDDLYGGGGLYGVPLHNGLPASCPKDEATTQMHEQVRAGYRRGGGGVHTRVIYKFRFETPVSSEHFHVKIRTVRLRQRAAQRMAGADEEMCGLELRFDNGENTSTADGEQTDVDLDY